MKIKVLDKTVDFFEHDVGNKSQLAVSSSSGTDSTIVLYLTALCFPNRKIIPYHIEESQYPDQKPNLLKIIDYFNSILPTKNIDILISDWVDYSAPDSKWRLKAIETPGELPPRPKGNIGQAKILACHHYIRQRFINGDFDYIVYGSTSNPPIEVLKELACPYEERRSRRNAPVIDTNFYSPFYHIDKSYIAEMFKEYNIMDVFPLTISCIEMRPEFKRPCKECFFCNEKKWAFGMYDGGMK
tara:strand:- start:8549 stop:9274 length:726 start_codon:yes stop_codon:yes gene_type:complete